MRSIKFNPFMPANLESLDRVFEEFFKPGTVAPTNGQHKPLVNVVESASDFKLELAAPGLTKEDFKIKIEKDQLIVSAEKTKEEQEEKENYARREFNYTSLKRSFHLPKTVEAEAIAANYENGILTLTLPKKEEAKEKGPRLVEVA